MWGRKMGASNKYILTVDDDPDIARLDEHALSIRGFKVSSFTDALMALDHFKANHKAAVFYYLISECRG